MRAVTDSGPTEPNSEVSAPVQNLFDIMDLVSKPDVIQHFKNAYSDCSIRYGDLKKQLAEDVWAFVAPIRERIVEIKSDDKALAKAAQTGADKAIASAERTLKEVREIIGFRRFY